MMFLPTISFGKKIPVASCQIKDVQKNEYVKASIIKYDCEDISDIDEIRNLPNCWQFKNNIADNMEHVYNTRNSNLNSYSFYAIKTPQDEVVGYAQTKDIGKDLVLDFLESTPTKKYKYVGTNMMSCLGGIALKNKFARLYIPNPVSEARSFYIKQCGFDNSYSSSVLTLSKRGMKKALKTTPIDFYI